MTEYAGLTQRNRERHEESTAARKAVELWRKDQGYTHPSQFDTLAARERARRDEERVEAEAIAAVRAQKRSAGDA